MENYKDVILDYIQHAGDISWDSYVEITPRNWFRKQVATVVDTHVNVDAHSSTSSEHMTVHSSLSTNDLEPWWKLINPVYAFSDRVIKPRLQKLMGTNAVQIINRSYLLKLQAQMKKDHLEEMNKRIKKREDDELDRLKELILEGLIPVEKAPKKLKNHPVLRITRATQRIILEKRAKIKKPNKISYYRTSPQDVKKGAEKLARIQAKEPERKHEEEDSSEDAGFVEQEKTICMPDAASQEDLAKGFMLLQNEYDQLKYEHPMVKKLYEAENVEKLYTLADEIVGTQNKQSKHLPTSSEIETAEEMC